MRLSVSLFLLLTQNLVWTRLLGLSGASALTRSNKAMLPSAVFVLILCPPACVFMTLFSAYLSSVPKPSSIKSISTFRPSLFKSDRANDRASEI